MWAETINNIVMWVAIVYMVNIVFNYLTYRVQKDADLKYAQIVNNINKIESNEIDNTENNLFDERNNTYTWYTKATTKSVNNDGINQETEKTNIDKVK